MSHSGLHLLRPDEVVGEAASDRRPSPPRLLIVEDVVRAFGFSPETVPMQFAKRRPSPEARPLFRASSTAHADWPLGGLNHRQPNPSAWI
jgi:hypothetical protein